MHQDYLLLNCTTIVFMKGVQFKLQSNFVTKSYVLINHRCLPFSYVGTQCVLYGHCHRSLRITSNERALCYAQLFSVHFQVTVPTMKLYTHFSLFCSL